MIIGFSGKKQSGKSTSSNFIISLFIAQLEIAQKVSINPNGQIVVSDLLNDRNYAGIFDLSNINRNDFILNKGTSFYENFSDIICANIKYSDHTEYLTSYFKQFVNNTCSLTPELILYNYPLIDKIEKEYILVILKNNKILRYLKTQELK